MYKQWISGTFKYVPMSPYTVWPVLAQKWRNIGGKQKTHEARGRFNMLKRREKNRVVVNHGKLIELQWGDDYGIVTYEIC